MLPHSMTQSSAQIIFESTDGEQSLGLSNSLGIFIISLADYPDDYVYEWILLQLKIGM